MTSFIINAHVDRKVPNEWSMNSDCPFCRIVRRESPAYIIYEDDWTIAILDILPLRPGHVLVLPKEHHPNLSDLPPHIAAAAGAAISKVAKALIKAMENSGLNVVCNQEYAQAVPHVHYHIIPAPTFASSPQVSSLSGIADSHRPFTNQEMHQKEFEARTELDEEIARDLVQKITAKL